MALLLLPRPPLGGRSVALGVRYRHQAALALRAPDENGAPMVVFRGEQLVRRSPLHLFRDLDGLLQPRLCLRGLLLARRIALLYLALDALAIHRLMLCHMLLQLALGAKPAAAR